MTYKMGYRIHSKFAEGLQVSRLLATAVFSLLMVLTVLVVLSLPEWKAIAQVETERDGPAFCWATADDGMAVFSSADATAVQQAVDVANPGDIVKVAGYCAGIQVIGIFTQTVYIVKNMTLQGGYTHTNWLAMPDPVAYPTTLDGQNNGIVAVITSSDTVTVSYLTLTNGRASGGGGGIYHINGRLFVINSHLLNNTAATGGGLYHWSTDVTIRNSQFTGNTTTSGSGGGVFGRQGTTTIISSTFTNNSANSGGGIYSQLGVLTVRNSQVQGNLASGGGGGIYTEGTALVENSVIINNTATIGRAGGIYNGTNDQLTVIDTLIMNNHADSKEGGGIYTGGPLTLTNSSLISNTAGWGGGLGSFLGTIDGNVATANGGGIYINLPLLTLTVTHSTISNNSAGNSGGGLHVERSYATLINSTVSGNMAGGSGGGITNLDNFGTGSNVALIYSTVYGNGSTSVAGIYNFQGTINMTSTIIAGNLGSSDCFGGMTSHDYNLDSDNSCNLTQANDLP